MRSVCSRRQRLLDLLGGGLFRAAIDLGHQKGFLAIPVAQSLAHAHFALAVVVVPAVVEEVDAVVERGADDADALLLVLLHADVISAEADHGNFLARAAQRAGGDRAGLGVSTILIERGGQSGNPGSLQKTTAVHSALLRGNCEIESEWPQFNPHQRLSSYGKHGIS